MWRKDAPFSKQKSPLRIRAFFAVFSSVRLLARRYGDDTIHVSCSEFRGRLPRAIQSDLGNLTGANRSQ
jgi:hypothetical protein